MGELIKVIAIIGLLISLSLLISAYIHTYISTQSKRNYLYKKLKTILLYYISVILKLGSLSWSGHQFHIAYPSLELIYKKVLPEMTPRGPEFLSQEIIDKILLIEL